MSIKKKFDDVAFKKVVKASFEKGLEKGDEIFGLMIKNVGRFYSDMMNIIEENHGKEVIIVGENPERRVPYEVVPDTYKMDHIGLGKFLKDTGFKEDELKELENVKKLEKICEDAGISVDYSDIQNGNLRFDLSALYPERKRKISSPKV